MSEAVMTDAESLEEIMKILPHRYPFLLVDRVIDFVPYETLRAVKNVTINEPCFMGHFPGYPVMPGVLICEALAQACGLLTLKSVDYEADKDNWFFLVGLDNVRFKKIVRPGDQLILDVKLEKQKNALWKYQAQALVNDVVACSATIMTAKSEAN